MLKKILYVLVIVLFAASCGTFTSTDSDEFAELDNIIQRAAAEIISRVPPNAKVALFNISASESVLTEYVIEELSVILVNRARFVILERNNLDFIRAEHNFQLSGEVSDEDIISIARKSGASFVISCSITGENELRRLRVKTLEVETGRVLSSTSHPLGNFPNVQNTQQANSGQNQQFNDLQKFIKTAEDQLKLTFDYSTKAEICWNVVEEIDIFLYGSSDEKLKDSVLETRYDWHYRAMNFEQTWEHFTDELISALEKKAEEISKSQNSGYNIQGVEIIDLRLMKPDSVTALMSLTFYVRMRGNILGINTRDFKLTVRGSINMRFDSIEVHDGYVLERI